MKVHNIDKAKFYRIIIDKMIERGLLLQERIYDLKQQLKILGEVKLGKEEENTNGSVS